MILKRELKNGIAMATVRSTVVNPVVAGCRFESLFQHNTFSGEHPSLLFFEKTVKRPSFVQFTCKFLRISVLSQR